MSRVATERKRTTPSEFEAGFFDLNGAAEFKNIMIHGDSGCGKTVLSGTVPGRICFIAGEPGYISAARLGARGKARIVRDTSMGLAAIEWLEDGHASDFDWVILDGATTLEKKFLLGYAAEAFDANPAKRAHRNLPDKPDYYNTQNYMKGWISRFIDLPVNFLLTCHSMRPDGDEGETLVYPGFQGKGTEISNFISGLFHTVGYMSIRVNSEHEEVRRVLWHHHYDEKTETRYFAKDQFNALPKFTDGWSMSQIVTRMDEDDKPPARKRAKAHK
jgi:hypothetical protein